ncbi:hypothetical protein [Paenibacillus sp. IHBB 3054]|uniref:hypothetical protein n=1 Tax=Paenibacillus sp. IHBB 3054 TaxID=3425689 RepID=UPI003F67E015
MDFDKVGALMFYDSENRLVGSVGMEQKDYTGEQIQSIAHGAMMDVFSVEEAEEIAYFKVETHYLVLQ